MKIACIPVQKKTPQLKKAIIEAIYLTAGGALREGVHIMWYWCQTFDRLYSILIGLTIISK